jgi:VWFA-related protein
MGNRSIFYLPLIAALALFFCAGPTELAQEKERPKLKNFGSSLKRIHLDDQKKAAVDQSKSTPKSTSDEIDVVKVETSLVTSDFLVLDARGNPVSGLTEKDFVITEDGKPQSVGMLSPGDNIKISRTIVLIIDYSASELPYIKTSIAAAKALVDKLPESDSMAIVTDDVKLIQDFTRDKKKLKHKLDSLLSFWLGQSKQYSALMATLKEAFNNEDQRPIVIFQTDGDQLIALRDSPLGLTPEQIAAVGKRGLEEVRKALEAARENFSLDDICRAAEKARATVYTVVPGHQMLGRSLDAQIEIMKKNVEDGRRSGSLHPAPKGMMTYQNWKSAAESWAKTQAALAAVSTSTGGWTMFLERPEDADRIYSSIFSDINRRYIVGYYPANKEHDGKRRKIDVTIRDHPDYVVVGRRWYYAPAADQ